MDRLGKIALTLVVVFALLFTWLYRRDSINKDDDVQDIRRALSEQEEKTNVLGEGLDILRGQLEDADIVPVVPPAEDLVDDLDDSDTIIVNESAPPSPEQIQAAVSEYCRTLPGGTCRGAPGIEPDDPDPDDPEVQDPEVDDPDPGVELVGATIEPETCHLILIFSDESSLDAGPACGPQGPAGPAPTDAELAQAVADFCGANPEACMGPAGPAGPAGLECPAGFTEREVVVVTPGTRIGHPQATIWACVKVSG